MTSITIPSTVEGLKAGLGGIESLLTAKEWERAAIVYAWTENGGMTVADFVSLEIEGLRSREQVNVYRSAWQNSEGNVGIKPGDHAVLPSAAWKDVFRSDPRDKSNEAVAKRAILADPSIIARAIETFPTVAHAAQEALGRLAVQQVTQTVAQHPVPFDYSRSVMEGFNAITGALFSLNRGTWTPTANDEQCLRLLRLALNDWADGQPVSIHDEIDTFLKSLSH